ncbi:hypothetical protein BHE90_017805, partial [Fusarium euwallaceae]
LSKIPNSLRKAGALLRTEPTSSGAGVAFLLSYSATVPPRSTGLDRLSCLRTNPRRTGIAFLTLFEVTTYLRKDGQKPRLAGPCR